MNAAAAYPGRFVRAHVRSIEEVSVPPPSPLRPRNCFTLYVYLVLQKIKPIYDHAVLETKRRQELAAKIRRERRAAGNKVSSSTLASKTGG